jgi:DNA-binding CsgD family transcriptional regulator
MDLSRIDIPAPAAFGARPPRIAVGAARGSAGHLRGALTRREREVLRLLGHRLTDQEIADCLGIGVRTVESHVAAIRAKLEAPNRRAAWWIARSLGLT